MSSVMAKGAPEPVGPYPHARRAGDFIFVSGMGPRQPGQRETPGITPRDIVVQTRATIENIKTVLEAAGSSLAEVVDVTCFLTHLSEDFARFNEIYGEYFAKIGPTRTTVEVTKLPTPICVELKAVAYSPVKTL